MSLLCVKHLQGTTALATASTAATYVLPGDPAYHLTPSHDCYILPQKAVKASGSISFSGTPSSGVRASGYAVFSAVPVARTAARGHVTFSGQPSDNDTITVNGVVVTWKTSGATGNQVNIGANTAASVAALVEFLNDSSDTDIDDATYSVDPTNTSKMLIVHDTEGTGGNAFTLSESSTVMTLSGGTLSGGLAGDTITINGQAITFGNQIEVGANIGATIDTLVAYLNASENSSIDDATYSKDSSDPRILRVVHDTVGTSGNAFTLAKSSSAITLSGATLAGGAARDTVTINGTAVTWGTDVQPGSSADEAAKNLAAFLNASNDSNIDDATYSVDRGVLTVAHKTYGSGGNAFTLAKSSSAITLSGATLSGGALTAATSNNGIKLTASIAYEFCFDDCNVVSYIRSAADGTLSVIPFRPY